jgi:DegV family protein with EDD domain
VEKYKGDDNIFVVTLSSKLSATYQNAVMAKKIYLEEYGKKFIHIFDSLSASIGEGLIAMKIIENAKRGLSNLEIVENVNNFIKNMRTYFLIDKFDALVKSGRMNPYVAKLASMLNIKPICGEKDGEIIMIEKARGYNKAVKRLIEIIKENAPDIENRIVGISHTICYEKAAAFKDELLKAFRVKDVIITEARGLVASYANKGGFVVSV